MTENVINNSLLKSFNFKTIDEVYKYKNLTVTQQSDYFIKYISYYFRLTKISTGDSKLYYYNEKEKLWSDTKIQQFEAFVYHFFDNTSTEIKMLVKNSKDEIDKYILKQIEKLCDEFDKESYHKKIINRSITSIYDIQFLSLLDNNSDFLPINNGKKINLKTLEITDRTYHDYFTYFSPVDYISNDKLPHADKFFKMFQPKEDNREYVRKVLGYTLTGDTKARKFFIWYGFGSNGKSQIFKFLNLILCKQYTSCEKSIFIKGKESSDGSASPEIMALLGKRCGTFSEGEKGDNIEMNISRMKQISGEDKIVGRPLFYKDGLVEFYPYIKLHFGTNYIPALDDQQATKKRIEIIFCDKAFIEKPKDKNYILKENEFLKDSIFTNKLETIYLSEIFSWIVRGSKKYYEDLKVEMTEDFKKRTEALLNNSDSIKTFIERKIKVTNNQKDVIYKKDIVDYYFTFCVKNEQRKQVRTSLFERLNQVGIFLSEKKLNNYDVYRCIQYIVDVDDDENDDQDLIDALTPKSGEIYDKNKIYPNNSVVITPEQYKEYIRLKSQMENVSEKVDEDEEVEEDNEDNEVDEEVEKKTPMKAKVNKNKNIVIDELEDMFIKEVKKPTKVINIMDEDNDNDEIPINNKKDKRQLRPKPNTEATHHDISVIKQLKLF